MKSQFDSSEQKKGFHTGSSQVVSYPSTIPALAVFNFRDRNGNGFIPVDVVESEREAKEQTISKDQKQNRDRSNLNLREIFPREKEDELKKGRETMMKVTTIAGQPRMRWFSDGKGTEALFKYPR